MDIKSIFHIPTILTLFEEEEEKRRPMRDIIKKTVN